MKNLKLILFKESMAEASKKEDQDLINKYVVKSKEDKNIKESVPVSNKGKYAILAVVCLIGAFLVGISFGLFTTPQTAIPAASVIVDDTAFPDFLANATNITSDNSSIQTTTDVSVDTNSSSDGSDSGDSNDDSDNGSNGNDDGDNSDSGDSNGGNSDNSGSKTSN